MSGFWEDLTEKGQQEFEIGDSVCVKLSVPSYAGRIGVVTSLEFGITVKFHDGKSMCYDEDMVTKVETRK